MTNTTEAVLFGGDDWWDRDGAFRLLHDVNPLRLRWLTDTVGNLAGKKLLDVGCGGGIFAEAACRAGARVTGVDAQAGAIACAQSHAAAEGLDIAYREEADLSAAVVAGGEGVGVGEYDIVTCFEMLEHVDNPAATVSAIGALLKPDGWAVFSTINRTFKAWALMIAGIEGVLRILPAGTHRYSQFVTPAELAAMCRQNDMGVKAVTGLRYSFFGRVYLLDARDTGVNYFLAARRRRD